MDQHWAEKLQRYVDDQRVQSLKQCQEAWTRLDMDSSLQQFGHPDMFKTLWGPILSRFLVSDNLTVRFGLIWLLFTLWKKHPSNPPPKISVTLTIWRFFVRIYRQAKSIRQPRMRDISSCMLKMFRGQAFQPEHGGKPVLAASLSATSTGQCGASCISGLDAQSADGQPKKRYRRNLQMITNSGFRISSMADLRLNPGDQNYLHVGDVPVPSSFDLPPSCVVEPLEEDSFVPLSMLHGDDSLALDSLSNFDAAFDPVVDHPPTGDSQEVLSWLRMESHDAAQISEESSSTSDEVVHDDAVDESSEHPSDQIELDLQMLRENAQLSSDSKKLVLVKRDARTAPYMRRSARRHGGAC